MQGERTVSAEEELKRRLSELRSSPGQAIDLSEISQVVEEVLSTLSGDLSAVDLRMYAEIEALHKVIESAKNEIFSVRADDIRNEHIPSATDELDAIVRAAEEATNAIMEAAETVEGVAGEIDEERAAKLTDAVTQIYEACSFQDLTGQRISKVVRTLKAIEAKVEGLLATFGDEVARKRRAELEAEIADDRPDSDLLNGPQQSESANSQNDIDALLASFD